MVSSLFNYLIQQIVNVLQEDEEPEEDREHTLQTARDRARRKAARRKKNTKWAMCLYIMPAALVLLGLVIAIIVLQVVYFLEGKLLDY